MPWGPTDVVAWLAGCDLAGPGALTEIDESLEALTADVTPLGPLGAIEHDAPLARVRYALTESGWLQERDASLRRLLADAPAAPWPSVVGFTGAAPGALVTIASDVRIRKRSLPPDNAGFARVQLEYYAHQPCAVYDEAKLVAGGQRVVGPAGAAPAAARRLDLGAPPRAGRTVLCLMGDGIVWGAATRLDVVLQHAVAVGGPWDAVRGAAVTVRPADGEAGARHVLLEAEGVRRHVGVSWTWTAPPAADLLASTAKLLAAAQRVP